MNAKQKEIIREYSEMEKRLESVYAEGKLTADELRNRRVSLYCELRKALSEEGAKKDILSDADLMEICGLKKEEFEGDQSQIEPGFDPLPDGAVCIFKGLKGTEALWLEAEPEGKCFTFQIPLSSDRATIWEEFQFEILRAEPGTEKWEGWNGYKGHGHFSMYSGEGTLMLTKCGESIRSVLYQKCYNGRR